MTSFGGEFALTHRFMTVPIRRNCYYGKIENFLYFSTNSVIDFPPHYLSLVNIDTATNAIIFTVLQNPVTEGVQKTFIIIHFIRILTKTT